MDKSKNFEPMKVWQDAQDIAVPVYNDLATTKDFSFCDPIKRVAVAILNNITEGATPRSSAGFSRFLDIAKGSTDEVHRMYLLGSALNSSTIYYQKNGAKHI